VSALTVGDVLRMPAVREAGPTVLAGRQALDRPVRWVHAAELADIGPLLRRGDLLLTTGIALPDTAPLLEEFAASLKRSDVAGLLIELGRRWTSVPEALVRRCEALELPLVALTREVRFAAVAQAVGERIIDEQLAELRAAQRVHDTFTELSVAEAGPGQILEAVQQLAGTAVVLENEQHHVLDYRAGPEDVGEFLADWERRSSRIALPSRTAWDEDAGWLLTRLGRRERGWGRLVVESATQPSARLVAVAERAAAALAMHRLHDRHRDSLVRRTHHELILGLLNDPTDTEVLRRCELAGLPTNGQTLVGLTVRPRLQPSATGPLVVQPDEVIATLVRSMHELGIPGLVCEIERDVRALLALPRTTPMRLVEELAGRVHRRHAVIVGVGRAASRTEEIDRTLREAQQVVESVRSAPDQQQVHRLEDVHLRGLLTLLADDDRLRQFVRRELDALRRHDLAAGTALLDAVRALLVHPVSKSRAAESLQLSRPAFYDRIAKAERLLGVDLDDPDIRVSLHVALLADELTSLG
jgi:purine catabolism regulator